MKRTIQPSLISYKKWRGWFKTEYCFEYLKRTIASNIWKGVLLRISENTFSESFSERMSQLAIVCDNVLMDLKKVLLKAKLCGANIIRPIQTTSKSGLRVSRWQLSNARWPEHVKQGWLHNQQALDRAEITKGCI